MAQKAEIVTLDGRNARDSNGVADLHVEFLPDSPVALFGDTFLREFFYGTLVESGLIGVTACMVDGKAVAFISYTTEPLGFMVKGIKRYPFRLSWIMLRSILRKPSTIGQIIFVLRTMMDRSSDSKDGGIPEGRGEIISLVADPAFQRVKPEGGTDRTTPRLFKEAMDYYVANGCDSFYLLVKPDNKASNLFCSIMGCEFQKIVIGGQTTHRYVYHIPA